MASIVAFECTSRPSALVAGLAILPPELVHQIFDDLSVVKILKILSHKVPHLDLCVLTHPDYQHVFTSLAVLDTIRDLFRTYYEICQHIRCTLSPRTSILSRNIATSPAPLTTDMLRNFLSTKIFDLLSKSNPWLSLLAFHSPRAPPLMLDRSPLDLHERWTWIREAEAALNNAKSRELNLAADILESELGRSMLKTPFDPSQENPRPNVTHIVKRLRGDAKQVLKDRILAGRFYTRRHWTIANTPLVPYNRHLEVFLKTISMHPPEDDFNTVMGGLYSTDVAEGSNTVAEKLDSPKDTENREAPRLHVYPTEIATDISLVLKGLYDVYIDRGPQLNNIRAPRIITDQSPVENDLEVNLEAQFVISPPTFCDYWSDKKNRYIATRRNRPETAAPHDERELVWLQAFLRTVSWMERQAEGLDE